MVRGCTQGGLAPRQRPGPAIHSAKQVTTAAGQRPPPGWPRWWEVPSGTYMAEAGIYLL